MPELEQIGPDVRSALGSSYLARADGDTEQAAALFAADLMRGNAETLQAGYTRENAVIAAEEVFPDATRAVFGVYLDELAGAIEDPARPKGVLGLNEYENGLVARALGAGEPLSFDEAKYLRKVARLAEKRRDEVKGRVEAVIGFLEQPTDGAEPSQMPTATVSEMREALQVYEEATNALLDAVTRAEGGGTDG